MKDWNKVEILVTGAGGFIASHLVERLASEGANIRAFVRYNSRGDPGLLRLLPKETLSSITIIPGDLRDGDAIRNAARDVDTIFHLGAIVSIPYSYIHPREVVETNVIGTLNVLEAARRWDVRRVVHTSTSEVYGTARRELISEAHPLQGQSPYSASKIGADKLAESFHRSYQLPVATLRPFNTYGPRQSARAVIPTIITQAIAGNQVKLGNLEPKRDFTFVSDTVEGFLRISRCDEALGEEINIGSGSTISIGDLALKILELVGRKLPLKSEGYRIRPQGSEVMRLQADVEKARKLFGWAPRVILEEGLRTTVNWIRDNIGLYRPGVYEV